MTIHKHTIKKVKAPKFSFKEVAPCLFAILIDILGFGLVAPLLISFFTSPETNIFQITSPTMSYFYLGLTLALYPLFMFFGSSFIGDLSDIIGRKKTLILSMLGMSFGFCLMTLGIITTCLSLFLVGRGLSGLVAASQSVALATISDLSTKSNKAIHISYIALIQCIGLILGPLMGGVLGEKSFYLPFLLVMILALIAFFWILFGFKETFIKNEDKKISFTRLFTIFIDGYNNKRVRDLSFAFLTMQIGIALYLPIILILLTTEYDYTPLYLGLFNGYVGIGFAFGLLVILPQMLKVLKIEQIVCLSLFTSFIAQFLSSILHTDVFIWLFAFPLAIGVEMAFTGMYTSFSNAANAKSQGWVMGISVALMAISWAFAGITTQLIPKFGVHTIIFIGCIFLGSSALLMKKYCSNHPI